MSIGIQRDKLKGTNGSLPNSQFFLADFRCRFSLIPRKQHFDFGRHRFSQKAVGKCRICRSLFVLYSLSRLFFPLYGLSTLQTFQGPTQPSPAGPALQPQAPPQSLDLLEMRHFPPPATPLKGVAPPCLSAQL